MDESFEDDILDEVAEVDLERLSARAREALAAAEAEAQRLGDEFVGTDHVLLGLSRTECCAARQILVTYELTPERLVQAMSFIRGEGSSDRNGLSRLYSPRLRRVLSAAGKIANKSMQSEIGTIHILSGLLLEGAGLAVFLLDAAGLSPKQPDFVIDLAAREGWQD